MGKRWKRRLGSIIEEEEEETTVVQQSSSKMIEHSITPYEIKTFQQQTYNHCTSKRHDMSVEDYNTYLKNAATRGFKIGADVQTTYGAPAKITSVKPTNTAISIWGDKPNPDCFIITRNDSQTPIHVGYNEDELTLLTA